MRFAVLGPLHVTVGDRSIDIERPRWRSVLAFLLLQNDRPVTTDTIVAAVWGDRAVPTAGTQVHTAISALRRKFRATGAGDLIINRPSGYTMDLGVGQVDASEFTDVVSRARQPVSSQTVADQLRGALKLWRGQALEGISGAFVEAARTRLEEERLRVVEQLMELELLRGNHGDVTAELLGYLEAHPLRESLVRLLILALYRSGRKSDALREYSRVRERLTSELGVEPGPELRELYLEILQDNPAARPAVPAQQQPVTRGPRVLPAASTVFTGRSAERAQLGHILAEGSETTPTVVAVNGSGGVGKSTLAVQVAHDLSAEYPGGQIYVDLQGSSPGLTPLTTTEVLGRCLHALGTTESDIPADEADARRCLRALSGNGRVLIVLDNAVDAGQVEPVIEALQSGGVIVTSRARLTLSTARVNLQLDALTPADAVVLLNRVAERTGSDHEPFNQIAAYCDYLPLALCLAGGRMAREPDLTGERLAASLADHRERLTVLEIDGAGVRSSIRVGYDLVAAGSATADRLAAHAFRVIGLLPLPSVDAGVIAALLCPDEPEAAAPALERLERSRLIAADGVGGYRLHDVVRATAYDYAVETMTPTQRTRLRHQAVAYFTACAVQSAQLLRPGRDRVQYRDDRAELAPPQTVRMSVGEADDVGPWLDRALPNIIAASQLAVETGDSTAELAVSMADALSWILRKRGEFHRERALALNSVKAAESLGDAAALRRALIQHGRVELYLGRLDEAVTHIDRALESARSDGDLHAQISALNDLGLSAIRRFDLPRARDLLLECLELVSSRQVAPHVPPIAMHNLAVIDTLLGNRGEAVRQLRRALELRRESGDRAGRGSDLVLLGVVECGLREFDEAGLRLREGVEICEDLGIRVDTWFGLAALAYLQQESGRHLEAIAVGQRCLAAAQQLNRPYAEKSAHDLLARAHSSAGEDVDARIHARYAVAIDSQPLDPEELIVAQLLS